ncbi:TIGR00730 family Rossman fold protein [Erysipelothrix sp. HDW6C]|uniref:LOG family protein n=1 Tax=Erysipelothrix sp. HDW6C TaxID=2714930 RepID=UPI00140B5690|nr:TIGR00730 family Rossman fold protein [Erysipelothrix sp. HDW6C]QIK68880.1 TIGR00730 family Rossman fold protein [Erysipelothrix sp. HDW6C]
MKIAVFCGSKMPEESIYRDEAIALANALVAQNIELVYGGAKIGIMGLIADTMLNQGGTVIGVMPHILSDKEIMHTGLTEAILVDDMSERKNIMNEMADAFIAFPGGCGTMDEIFEVITLNQIGHFSKPCGFVNVDGYYDGIETYINRAVAVGFTSPEHGTAITFKKNSIELIDSLIK